MSHLLTRDVLQYQQSMIFDQEVHTDKYRKDSPFVSAGHASVRSCSLRGCLVDRNVLTRGTMEWMFWPEIPNNKFKSQFQDVPTKLSTNYIAVKCPCCIFDNLAL